MNVKLPSDQIAGAFDWVADVGSVLAVLLDLPGGMTVIAASRGFGEAMGFDPANMIGRRLEDLTLTENALLLGGALRTAKSGHVTRTVITSPSAPNTRRRLEVLARPASANLLILEGRWLSTAPQISDRRRAELFEQLSNLDSGLVYIYDVEGPRTRRFDLSKLLGYPAGHRAAVGEGVLELLHPDDFDQAVAHCHGRNRLPDDVFVTIVCRILHADGQWRWIELRERVLDRSREGRVRRVLGIASDVTERRRLMASLAIASKALLVAEAEERQRIARELHDSTAQHLVAIDLSLGRLERRMAADPQQHEALVDIRQALAAAHREVRTFSYLLHPPDLARNGLVATLRKFVEGFAGRAGLIVHFSQEGEVPPLQQVGELALFRVAQEALMNVHHHAAAKRVDISLQRIGDIVTLAIRDDGRGMRPADLEAVLGASAGGVGIAGMRARMEQIGGDLAFTSCNPGMLIQASLRLGDSAGAPPQ